MKDGAFEGLGDEHGMRRVPCQGRFRDKVIKGHVRTRT
jgi:hypothetical protein